MSREEYGEVYRKAVIYAEKKTRELWEMYWNADNYYYKDGDLAAAIRQIFKAWHSKYMVEHGYKD